jgi:hypothetical protein
MQLPWPVRPIVDYSRRHIMLRSGLRDLNGCSDALKPVKVALSRSLRLVPTTAERQSYSAITRRLDHLRNRTDTIDVTGDSVPPHMLGRKIVLGEHAANASTTRPWGDFLFQLIRVTQPTAALELGTCVGMSASFMAAAMQINRRGHL